MKRSAMDEMDNLMEAMAKKVYSNSAPHTSAEDDARLVVYPELEAKQVRWMSRLASDFKAECGECFTGNRWVRHLESWLWQGRQSTRSNISPVFPTIQALQLANQNLAAKLAAAGVPHNLASKACSRLAVRCQEFALSAQRLRETLSLDGVNAIGGWRPRVRPSSSSSSSSSSQLRAVNRSRIKVESFTPGPPRCSPSRTDRVHASPLEPQLPHPHKLRLTFKKTAVEVRRDHYYKLLVLYRHVKEKDRKRAAEEPTEHQKRKKTKKGNNMDNISSDMSGIVALPTGLEDHIVPYASPEEQDAVFCLLARYFAACGASHRGGSDQAAAPEPVFACLHKHFGVTSELFASPLNAGTTDGAGSSTDALAFCENEEESPLFCGAFSDVDSMFGGGGSFFDFKPPMMSGGSYWVNPPFEDGTILATFDHLESLFAQPTLTHVPLSFVVVFPSRPDTAHHRAFAHSSWCETHITLPQTDHGFFLGAQHAASIKQQRTVTTKQGKTSADSKQVLLRASNHDSSVFVMRNAAAQRRWGPMGDTKERELRRAFRVHDGGQEGK